MTTDDKALCVCIESPLRGEIGRNRAYADACMLDALERGEAPFLGHLLYPRVLDDDAPLDRAMGIAAHVAWLRRADLIAVYTDLGITEGMRLALVEARRLGVRVEYRQLDHAWLEQARIRATPGFL